MKHILLSLIFFPLVTFSITRDTLESYQLPKSENAQLVMRFDFAKGEVLNPKIIKALEGGLVRACTFVYTSYALSPSFNQERLNEVRFDALSKLIPSLLTDSLIQFNTVVQTACNSPEEGRKMFHGAVIEYLKADDPASIDADISYLNDLFEEKTHPEMVLNSDGSGYEKYDAAKHKNYKPRVEFEDSVVLAVLNRNNWNKVLVVSDLTASMHAYVAQVMKYAKERAAQGELYAYTFFNDGNGKMDRKIGKTGGLYHGIYTDFISLFLHAKDCVRNRGRNDIEENDFEALLKGMEEYKDAEEIVLIVDNRSPVRDYGLISKMNRPVRIILGHYEDQIGVEYLQLAYQTKGSIHFKEMDLDFSNLDKENLIVGHKRYYVLNGRAYERWNI